MQIRTTCLFYSFDTVPHKRDRTKWLSQVYIAATWQQNPLYRGAILGQDGSRGQFILSAPGRPEGLADIRPGGLIAQW